MVGPATGGFDMFYRLETTDPDGEWSFIDFNQPTGSCDFSISWCETWGTKAFHNYTVRIMAFNTEGYGLATDPYRVTTKENSNAYIILLNCRFWFYFWAVIFFEHRV